MKAVTGLLLGIFLLSSDCIAAEAVTMPASTYLTEGRVKGLVLLIAETRQPELVAAIRHLDYAVTVIPAETLQAANPQGACIKPAAALLAMATEAQSRHLLPVNRAPILVGNGAGSALVYQALLGAAPGDFHAGISQDFCPPPTKPACDTQSPLPRLPVNWYVLQGHPSCDAGQANRFLEGIEGVKRVDLADQPKPNGVPSELIALLQWLDPGIPGQTSIGTDVEGVPLTERRASVSQGELAILLSGDGGWAAIDNGIAIELAAQGIDTVGWDSLSYYWTAKSPELASRDLERVIDHYRRRWQSSRIMLIGYSFGADVLPFLISRLSPDAASAVKLAAFLGLSGHASFEFHLSDWLDSSSDTRWPTIPEIAKLHDLPKLCLYGAGESDSACPNLRGTGIEVIEMPGDHHFDSDFRGIAARLVRALRRSGTPKP